MECELLEKIEIKETKWGTPIESLPRPMFKKMFPPFSDLNVLIFLFRLRDGRTRGSRRLLSERRYGPARLFVDGPAGLHQQHQRR